MNTFPAMDNVNCPYCMAPVGYESMQLWDGRRYCCKCIDEVCPAIAAAIHEGKPLTDVVT